MPFHVQSGKPEAGPAHLQALPHANMVRQKIANSPTEFTPKHASANTKRWSCGGGGLLKGPGGAKQLKYCAHEDHQLNR